MSDLQTRAQDLLVIVRDDSSSKTLIEAYRNCCGSDEYDDWSQQEASFITILRELAGEPR